MAHFPAISHDLKDFVPKVAGIAGDKTDALDATYVTDPGEKLSEMNGSSILRVDLQLNHAVVTGPLVRCITFEVSSSSDARKRVIPHCSSRSGFLLFQLR